MTSSFKSSLLIDVTELFPSPGNRAMGDLSSLRDSMRDLGQLMPLLVTPREEGGYRVIAGHRRRAAALFLHLPKLECKVIEGGDLDLIHVADNQLREGLSLSEKADLAAEIVKHHSLEKAAKAFGQSTSHVRTLARLRREFPEVVWERLVSAGKSARVTDWSALLALSPEQQILRSVMNGKKERKKITRRLREIEQMLLDLPARDVRAEVLRWVLRKGDFPQKHAPNDPK